MEPVWVAIGSFLLAVVVQVVVAVWVLRGLEASILARVQIGKDDVERQIREVRESAATQLVNAIQARGMEMDILRKSAGEIGHSLREKISQVELFVRDEFVCKDDFKMHLDVIRDQLSLFSSRLDAKFDSFEKKLDALTRRDV